ncbi:amidohydrolase family protein [Kibdelosporangium lantanae]
MVVRIRGRALPTGEYVDLYADGDRWTTDPVPGADLVAEGWLLPGLVDAHTHPGAEAPSGPLDHAMLRADLREHVAAGVTLIRSPGLAGEPPAWFGEDPDVPRAVHAGPWIVQPGYYFENAGRPTDYDDMPRTAAEQAARTGWVKIVTDWGPDDPHVPTDVLKAVVDAVHGVGGRLAVHSQVRDGGAAAVAAGVDSVEHGMCLDPELLDQMARQGTALTPTLAGFQRHLPDIRTKPEGPRKAWILGGIEALPYLAATAVEAGVTVLAGTDSRPHGRIVDEVRALAGTGMKAHDALGAASWTAREYLGLPGLVEGAPADAVVYAEDPRGDLDQLDTPVAVVLRGRRVR